MSYGTGNKPLTPNSTVSSAESINNQFVKLNSENERGQDTHPNFDSEAPFPPDVYRGKVKTLAREKDTGRLVYLPGEGGTAHYVQEVPSSPTLKGRDKSVVANIPDLDPSVNATLSRPDVETPKLETPKFEFDTDPNFVTVSTKDIHPMMPKCGTHVHKASPRQIPEKFGLPDGAEIDNKDCIMAHIDRAIGTGKPPAVEFIFCEPYLTRFGSWNKNPFGHACVRYTLPSGQQCTPRSNSLG
jgi:hypothetical protein